MHNIETGTTSQPAGLGLSNFSTGQDGSEGAYTGLLVGDVSPTAPTPTPTTTTVKPWATKEAFRIKCSDGSIVTWKIGPDKPGWHWRNRSRELAEWTMSNLVNRSDACGRYRSFDKRTPGPNGKPSVSYTDKTGVDTNKLSAHFHAYGPNYLRGLHATAVIDGQCLSRWLVTDIDCHDNTVDPSANERYAMALYRRAVDLGFRPILLKSNGDGGYHLLLLFDRPIPTNHVHAFGLWLTDDWSFFLPTKVETFPKQASIAEDGFGNFVRIFGRHHTRTYWSEVWDGSRWLDGNEAIDHVLATTGSPASLIPTEAILSVGDVAKPKRSRSIQPRKSESPTSIYGDMDTDLARQALPFVANMAETYDDWLAIGFALSSLGDHGFTLWDDWSREHCPAKYSPGICADKWSTFDLTQNGVGLGTLFYLAAEAGWKRPSLPLKPEEMPGHTMMDLSDLQHGVPVATLDPDGQPLGDTPPPNEVDYEDEAREAAEKKAAKRTLQNWYMTDVATEDPEKTKKVPRALTIHQIVDALKVVTPGWPKRVDQTLFMIGKDHEPEYLTSSVKLIARLDREARINWKRGDEYVTQERLYEHLRMTSEPFLSIERLPHTPPIGGVYYSHQPLPKPSGKLDEFLDFFAFASPEDREIFKAFIMTPHWGGRAGGRPGLVITGPDDDGNTKGRGVGKTTTMDESANLAGGSADLGPTEDIGPFKTRLLSPKAAPKRIIRLDNLKSYRFSRAELENLVTCEEISGRQLYAGEGSKPNHYTVMLTVNGASMSKDMSQRFMVVKLARPVYRAGWKDEVREFVQLNRWEILAEISEILARPPGDLKPATRWSTWERDVLSKVDHATECQRLLIARQAETDDDDDEVESLRIFFLGQINKYMDFRPENEAAQNAENGVFFLSSETIASWVSAFKAEKYSSRKASRYIKYLHISCLCKCDTTIARGWLWTGTKVKPGEEPKTINLL